MKILIAYYSKTGNTERLAKDLAKELGADLEKLIDKKKRSGLWGYLQSGRDAMKKILTEIEPLEKKVADYDLVIVGMPIWGWNLVPATRTFLEQHKQQIGKYAFFTTSGGTEASTMTPYFKEVMGAEPLAGFGLTEKELKADDVYQKKLNDFVMEIKKI